jgi:hypothetical protein
MGLFDEIGKAMKKVEEEVKKADLDTRFREIGDGINKAGADLSHGSDKAGTPVPVTAPQPAAGGESPAPPRKPHPGYSRITAWMKTRYKGKIGAAADPYQRTLELEQISAEACSGLSAKTKKGFLEYLKSQNYEQLLR